MENLSSTRDETIRIGPRIKIYARFWFVPAIRMGQQGSSKKGKRDRETRVMAELTQWSLPSSGIRRGEPETYLNSISNIELFFTQTKLLPRLDGGRHRRTQHAKRLRL